MRRFITTTLCFALFAASMPARAEVTDLPTNQSESIQSFKLAEAQTQSAETLTPTVAQDEKGYRIEKKKSGTGRKVLKGAAIGLAIVGVVVGGLLLAARAKCGAGWERCSE